jgi:hypothetical protein
VEDVFRVTVRRIRCDRWQSNADIFHGTRVNAL